MECALHGGRPGEYRSSGRNNVSRVEHDTDDACSTSDTTILPRNELPERRNTRILLRPVSSEEAEGLPTDFDRFLLLRPVLRRWASGELICLALIAEHPLVYVVAHVSTFHVLVVHLLLQDNA